MDPMLQAAKEAAEAANSSAVAAWWALGLNGVAAFGAVGALWYSVLQGGRAARFERLRIGALCHAIHAEVAAISALIDGKANRKKNGQYIKKSGALVRVRRHLDIASHQVIPDARAQTSVGMLLMILDLMENEIAEGGDGSFNLGLAEEEAVIFAILGYRYLGRSHPEPWLRGKYLPRRSLLNWFRARTFSPS